MRPIRVFDSRHNNFDLLRLFAASQVVFFHAFENLGVAIPEFILPFSRILEFFPGVPIFFVISGFLISSSYERNPNLLVYAVNRSLRIYPGLWVCTFITLIMILIFWKQWTSLSVLGVAIAKWIISQLTIAQFYNPHVLKGFGVGHINGALWTIPVELQFYILVPLIYLFCIKGKTLVQTNGRLGLGIVIFFSLTVVFVANIETVSAYNENLALLFRVSVIPYLYMFLLGVVLQKNPNSLRRWVQGKAMYWVVGYLVVAHVGEAAFGWGPRTSTPNLLPMGILSVAVISLAFTFPRITEKLLGGNDISYGTYIFHMIVINVLFELGFGGRLSAVGATFVLTYLVAALSWVLIERPALSFKRRSSPAIGPTVSAESTSRLKSVSSL